MTMYYSTNIYGITQKEDIWEGYDRLWEQKRKAGAV